MIQTDSGSLMFHGVMMIFPQNNEIQPYTMLGTWYYKPQTHMWYCEDRSYPADICHIISDMSKKSDSKENTQNE